MAEPTKRAASARSGAAKAPAKKAAAAKAAAKRPAAGRAAAAAAIPAAEAVAVATPAPPEAPRRSAPLSASGSTWSISFKAAAVVLVIAAFGLLFKLQDQSLSGPAHEDLSIGDGIPATLYLPVDADDVEDGGLPAPAAEGERPPVVVMAHGYSADRASMSGMARSLAEAGYAVLNIDLRGHGANTHGFEGDLRDDFDAAVDWATTSPYVDGERLAVLGHSMGAGAALSFATVDDRPLAVIPVSGGWEVNDAVVPKHTLFLVASGDPGRIHDRQEELAATLEAADGDVTRHEVEDRDHITVLRADDTIRSIVEFLDPIMGIERVGRAPGLVDPRMETAVLYLAVVLGLIALLGLAVGQSVPVPAAPDGRPGKPWWGVALAFGALVVTMPLLSMGGFDLLPLGAGEPIVMHLALASAVLWGGRALAKRGQVQGQLGAWLADGQWWPTRSALVGGLAAAGVIVTLLLPLAGVFHRMVPTTERAVYWVVLSIVVAPFWLAFEALTRRGKTLPANAFGAGGKVALLVVLFAGVAVGALPGVIGLIAPLLVLQYVLVEVFAGSAYARGRNVALVAVAEAVFMAYLAVTLTPVG